MGKVYIVTQGEYSDYGIVAVFATRKLAEECVRHMGHLSDADVEEWELNSELPRKRQYHVKIIRTTGRITSVTDRGLYGEEYNKVFCSSTVARLVEEGGGWENMYHYDIRADSVEAAKKIAAERRMIEYAKEQGI